MKKKFGQENLPMEVPVDKWIVTQIGKSDSVANQRWQLKFEKTLVDKGIGPRGEQRLKNIAGFLNNRRAVPNSLCKADTIPLKKAKP